MTKDPGEPGQPKAEASLEAGPEENQQPTLNSMSRLDIEPDHRRLVAPDPSGWRRLHLVGIGGAGMSGVAHLLLARGFEVTGSDIKETRELESLRRAGATVFIGHDPRQVGDPDAVVVSSAIPSSNVEVLGARGRGIPVLLRGEVLVGLMRGRRGVAVAGTHGKTTTTSMIAVMLSGVGLDPTYVIGADLNEIGSRALHGSGEFFVAETDESDQSFVLFEPEIAVLTNVEEDHLDFYGSRAEIEEAFAGFASRARAVVACWDDPGVRTTLRAVATPKLTYGMSPESDLVVRDLRIEDGGGSASVELRGKTVPVHLSVPGRHNLVNAGAALAVASLLGLPLEEAAEALGSFTGVRRRFEYRGEERGVAFVDDYAHHPTEVKATLETAASKEHSRVVAVFQPHRYTRTRAMWRALGESLGGADLAVFTDVYGAGEVPIPGITGKLLVEALAELCPGKRIVYLPKRSEVARFLAREVRTGDLVLTLGAGDITMVGEETLERLREKAP
jgi:UDP-N-acetylmuramate--alanine ligase